MQPKSIKKSNEEKFHKFHGNFDEVYKFFVIYINEYGKSFELEQ